MGSAEKDRVRASGRSPWSAFGSAKRTQKLIGAILVVSRPQNLNIWPFGAPPKLAKALWASHGAPKPFSSNGPYSQCTAGRIFLIAVEQKKRDVEKRLHTSTPEVPTTKSIWAQPAPWPGYRTAYHILVPWGVRYKNTALLFCALVLPCACHRIPAFFTD